MKIYVGNLQHDMTEEQLKELFIAQGPVESVVIVRDRDTYRSKGFAFVEMGSNSDAQAAITALNGHEFHQRNLVVNEARPPEGRSSSYRAGPRPNPQGAPRRVGKRGPAKRSRRQRR